MKDGFHVIDSDLHVIETGDIYERYLDDKYRDKMPKYLGLSPTNFPHWDVQGQMIPPWARSEDVVKAQQFLDAPTEHMYKSVREKGYDADSTLKAMNAEGIDIGVVYRTFAHMVVSIDDLQPAYATAYCAAFNDWLADYCNTNPKRLKAAAILPLHDPELAATEARRAVEKKGHVGVILMPMPIKDRYFHSPECDVLWKEITRLNVPIAFHGTSGGASKDYVSNRFRGKPNFRTQNHASAFPLELMLAMSAMIVGGVLERFPAMRVGFLEGNCGWLPWWLHRLDDQWKKYGGGEQIKLSLKPSEIFRRQCFIGTDVDEDLLKVVVDELGDDNIVMSVDYPHADGSYPNGIKTFLDLPGVSKEAKRKIMWGNCLKLYGFNESQLLAA